jgi:sulfate permease, SulP family
MKFHLFAPLLQALKNYDRSSLWQDVLAGLTVCVLLVPQGMAYALLAGVPPIYGLYASIVPVIVYALTGSSRHLAVGPVALLSLLLLSGLSSLAEPGSPEFINLALVTALIAGVIQFALGLARLGVLINFLSNPVFTGFIAAAVVIILASQLVSIFGLPEAARQDFISVMDHFFSSLDKTHIFTFLMGAGSIVIYWGLKLIYPRLPGALIIVALSTLFASFFRLDLQGVAIVGTIPKGLPGLVIPAITWKVFIQLLPLAMTVSLISFVESLAIAKQIVSKSRDYRLNPNQELLALGLSKVAGAFFQAIPTDGSFSRSALNYETGGKTTLSGLFTAVCVALVLLFLTPLFYYLPKAALSAIIVVAVSAILDFKEIRRLYRYHKIDFVTMLTTFLLTIFLGVQQGVLSGVILSVAFIIYRSSQPHIAILGQIPGTPDYRNILRFPQVHQWPEILIFRFDAQLYFANASYFQEKLMQSVEAKGPQLKHVILDASSITDIDFTGMQIIIDIVRDLQKRNITFTLAGCIGPVRDFILKTSLKDVIVTGESFLNVHNAVDYIRRTYLKEPGTPDDLC